MYDRIVAAKHSRKRQLSLQNARLKDEKFTKEKSHQLQNE